ncbi:MAG: tRNA (adenosine(37)-N6)-threonylcarbamoyltransferase complex dimerization subunit type 1 TsaB [Bacteroidetes bacterium]|nr:tRNA (adenosine(37)-N6)-threonylcarbamoyltransferase complex dimerization subunit type 1 TsaB [Bacteroidota bacterium]
MGLLLNLETATGICSVALAKDGQLLASEEDHTEYSHSSVLNKLIRTVMNASGKQLNELDAVCVSAGPGSYTGLRIGLSSAKGICFALDKPLISIPTLKALASNLLSVQAKPNPFRVEELFYEYQPACR